MSQRDEKLRTRSITLLTMCFVVVVLVLDVACSSPSSSPNTREAEINSSTAKQSLTEKQSVAGQTVEPSSTANVIETLSIEDLPNVVAQHRGSFVLVDLWALW